MKTLIVDDEPLARRRLSQLLAALPDVDLVGSASDGSEALRLSREHRPQLMLLDVEMPGTDGFDVVEALAEEPAGHAPLIIFTTAFSKFAVQAFDCGAVDFLTKPLRRQRLDLALERARRSLEAREADGRLAALHAQVDALRRDRDSAGSKADPLWIPQGGQLVRVMPEEIDRIDAEGEYVRLHVGGQNVLHRMSLTQMLEELDEDGMLRVHRSHAIHRRVIRALTRNSWGGPVLLLEDDRQVPVGRKFVPQVKAALGLEA